MLTLGLKACQFLSLTLNERSNKKCKHVQPCKPSQAPGFLYSQFLSKLSLSVYDFAFLLKLLEKINPAE